MNLINHSLHLDLMTLSDPLPPPLVSAPLHLPVWLIRPSIRGHAAVRLMSLHRRSVLTYSDYCSAAAGGTGGPPSLQHGPVTMQRSLPSQAPFIREQGNWNGFDRIVLHLLRPRTISPCFACHSATAENTSSLASPRDVKPVKSTELSRSDGRGQNSIWCALFVDCVRLVAEGTRRGAYHAEMEQSPHPSTKHPPALPNNEKWKNLQLV